jgi:hypothetical protein
VVNLAMLVVRPSCYVCKGSDHSVCWRARERFYVHVREAYGRDVRYPQLGQPGGGAAFHFWAQVLSQGSIGIFIDQYICQTTYLHAYENAASESRTLLDYKDLCRSASATRAQTASSGTAANVWNFFAEGGC